MKLEVGMYYRYKGIIGKYYKPDLGKPFFLQININILIMKLRIMESLVIT